MYNDLQAQEQDLHPVEINHIDYAFLAAKNGEVDFLEVLLGPSIPAELRQRELLLTKTQGVFEVADLWEFRGRLAEAKLAALKDFKGNQDNLRELNEALVNAEVIAIDASLDLLEKHHEMHSTIYYHSDQPQFPTLDLHDHKHGRSLLKMADFFAAQGNIQHNEQNIYCVPLDRAMKATLKNLQTERYRRQAAAVNFDIMEMSDVDSHITYLERDLATAKMEVEVFLDKRTVINNEIATLDDLQYGQRRKRFDDLVERFQANPSSMPSVYRVASEQLPSLLKSARVPVDVFNEKDGNTLLHVASEARQYHVVRLLLDRGADLNARNLIQATPWDLARLTNATELKALAKVYKKRSESKFLADVVKDVNAYKEGHEKVKGSYKRHLHTERRLAERAKQLVDIQSGIEKAKQVPTDDLLVLTILTVNLLATRGSRGRSTLLDPLMGHVSRYLKEKGYGVTNQDIVEIFNGEQIQAVDAALVSAHNAAMEENRRLQELLRERDATIEKRDRVIAQKIEAIKTLEMKNETREKEIFDLARDKKSYEAEIFAQAEMRIRSELDGDKMRMEAEISQLKESMDKLLLLVTQLSGAAPVESAVRLANMPGTLFVEAPFPGSGRYGAIPMNDLGKEDAPMPNRPN